MRETPASDRRLVRQNPTYALFWHVFDVTAAVPRRITSLRELVTA
ncbi:hypothetical protein WBG06_24310 [Nocardioides sp. CCNWLW239]